MVGQGWLEYCRARAFTRLDRRVLEALRNEGGSVGTSLAQPLQERREQFHTLRLGESLDPFNPAVQSFLEQAQARFLQQTGDPAAAQQLAWQALENLRHQHASALAYFDCFWLFAVVILAVTRRLYTLQTTSIFSRVILLEISHVYYVKIDFPQRGGGLRIS
jgi:hypothetical protein